MIRRDKKNVVDNTLEKKWGKVDYSLELWPLIVFGVLLAGIVHLNVYYQYHYRFNIVSYLELSEILIASFVNIGVLDVGLFLLFSSVFLYSIPYFFGRFGSDKMFKVLKISSVILKHILNNRKINKKYYMALSFEIFRWLCIWLLLFLLNRANMSYKEFSAKYIQDVNMLIFNYLAFSLVVILALSFYFLGWPRGRFVIYCVFFYFILNVLVMLNERRYTSLSKFHFSYGSKIFTEKDTLVSDSNFYYVDKSRNYVFMWKEKDSSMVVIPMSEIKKMEIKNGAPKTNKPPQKKVSQTNKKTSKK